MSHQRLYDDDSHYHPHDRIMILLWTFRAFTNITNGERRKLGFVLFPFLLFMFAYSLKSV